MRERDARKNRTRGGGGGGGTTRDNRKTRTDGSSPSRSGRRSLPLLLATTTTCRRTALLLLVLLGATTTTIDNAAASRSLTGDGVFDALDVDRDGRIDRVEFDAGLAKVERALVGGGGDESVPRGGDDPPDVPEIGGGRRRKDEEVISSAAAAAEAAAEAAKAGGGGGAEASPQNLLLRRRPPQNYVDSVKEKDGLKFWPAFTSSVAMILATEIGDKTFFIAAVLSMRNHRAAVFGGAILALIVMTILSTMMGLVLPNLLPRSYTHVIGGLLFLYFGIKLIVDSRSMEADKVSDELEEVEDELLHSRKKDEDDVEGGNASESNGGGAGGKSKAPVSGGGGGPKKSIPKRSESSMSAASIDLHGSIEKTFVQSLTLTFLAEWGDRSQIATIALAAAKDPYGVTIGGCVGHCICTGMAVMGGRMLAARISEKTVSLGGGCIFLAFGLHSLFFEA